MELELKVETILVFDPKVSIPRSTPDEVTYSEDVFIIDEFGMSGMAYYSFEDEKWYFHTDTLVDYNEVGNKTKWAWYYPPVKLSEVKWDKFK